MEIAEGTRKRSRSSDGGSSAGGPDRLSALPDCLLHEIMSSLKARQVVQTCVLSKRWRHLWRSVPCLDVDIAEFRCSGAGGGGDDISSSNKSNSDDDSSNSDTDSDSDYDDLDYFHDKGKGWVGFEDFAASLLHRCNLAELDSFRLDIDRGRKPPFVRRTGGASHDCWTYSGRQAEAWLRRAMKYQGPTADHASTISRQEYQGLNLISPMSWRLKRLHLRYVPLEFSFGFGEHLNSVCSSLEDLELDHCTCEIRKIASDSLKKLVLKNCSFNGFLSDIACPTLKTLVIDGGSNGYANPNPLAISAPMVAYLRLYLNAELFHGGISINKTMPSLDRASIHLRCHKYGSSRGEFGRLLYGDQSELLCSVSNATSLELSGVGTMVLGEEPKFQEFQNLRNLLLGSCDLSDDFRVLRFFHRGSPNLEVTLRHCQFPGDSNDKEGTHSDADDKEGTHSDANDKEGTHNDSDDEEGMHNSGCCCGLDFLHVRMNPQFPGGRHKLNKTSSSNRCSLDFLRDENIKLEIIHKKDDNDVCRSADKLVLDLPPNPRGTDDDVVPDAATDASEDSMPHSTGVGPGRGTWRRMTNVLSGPEWD